MSAPTWHNKDYPCDSYEYIATDTLADFEKAIAKVFEPRHYISDGHTGAKLSLVRLPYLDLSGVLCEGNIQEHFPNSPESYFIVFPIQGKLRANHLNQDIPALRAAMVVSPGEPVDVSWNNCKSAIVRINPDILHAYAERFEPQSNSPVPALPKILDLRQGCGLSLANTLHTMVSEIQDDNSLLSQGFSSKTLNELFLASLLRTQCQDNASHFFLQANTMARVRDYIDAHLSEDICLSHLAGIAGVSIRKLQADWSKQYGMGPMSFIRQEKLKQVHRELQLPNNDHRSIADIASQWGFNNPSYFSNIYKQAFGEKPTDTRSQNNP